MTTRPLIRRFVSFTGAAGGLSLAVLSLPLAASAGAGSGELLLVNTNTTKCLTIAGGVSTANNVEAVQFDCDQ